MTNQRLSPLAWLGIGLVVAIALLALFGALSMSSYGGYYGMMGSGSWGWGLLMMAVPGVLLIVILLAALGGLGERPMAAPSWTSTSPSAVEVLDSRYARGELSREDYLKIRADLTQVPAHP